MWNMITNPIHECVSLGPAIRSKPKNAYFSWFFFNENTIFSVETVSQFPRFIRPVQSTAY